jgi:two-component system chemotaxis response regulator CheB
MCHYLLAEAPQSKVPSGRYGHYAIDLLLGEMLAKGAAKKDIVANIYGGGAVVDAFHGDAASIGERNVIFAERKLKELGFKINHRDVGGTSGRRIALDTTTGHVECWQMNQDEGTSIAGVKVQRAPDLVRVLIVDDSATVRTILKNVFDHAKGISVVGTATDPFDAREKIIKLKPNVLTLDVEMPKMNGIQFLERLMIHHPLPVVIVSSLSSQGTAATRALELGAIEFVHKPSQFDPQVLKDLAETLVPKIIGAAAIEPSRITERPKSPMEAPRTARSTPSGDVVDLIAIAGNGGSAEPFLKVLSNLANDCPPIVAAISPIGGFVEAWIKKNQARSPLKLHVAQTGTPLSSGHVYIASAHQHVKIVRQGQLLSIATISAPPNMGQRPSADILFESITEPSSAIAVLLSGYGKDGVVGLGQIHEAGGYTICQSPDEAAFNFSVTAAIAEGYARDVATSDAIATLIYDRRSAAVAAA